MTQDLAVRPRTVAIIGGIGSMGAKLSLAQLAPMLVSLYLARLVAHHGAAPFSAYSIVCSINLTCIIAVTGFLQSLYYVCGRALGRHQPAVYDATVWAGLAWGLLLGAGCALISVLAGPVVRLLGLSPALVPYITRFGLVAACGLPPATVLMVLRVHATMQAAAGLVTAVYLGGAALTATIATVLAPHGVGSVVWVLACGNWVMLLALLGGMRLRRIALPARPPMIDFRPALGVVFSTGWPTGAIIFLDSVASLVSVMIVARFWLPVTPLHAAVLLCVSVGLVGPLGLAQAAVQRVSITNAAGDFSQRDRNAWVSIIMAALYGILATLVMAMAGGQAAVLLVGPAAGTVPPVLLHRVVLLGGVVLGLQSIIVVAASALRGLGVAKAPLLQALIGYGVVAAGGELLFSLTFGAGAAGVWWGLVTGFAATAFALLLRCAREFRHSADRPAIEGRLPIPLAITGD